MPLEHALSQVSDNRPHMAEAGQLVEAEAAVDLGVSTCALQALL